MWYHSTVRFIIIYLYSVHSTYTKYGQGIMKRAVLLYLSHVEEFHTEIFVLPRLSWNKQEVLWPVKMWVGNRDNRNECRNSFISGLSTNQRSRTIKHTHSILIWVKKDIWVGMILLLEVGMVFLHFRTF